MAWDINVPVGALYGQPTPKSPADLRDVLTGIARDVANSPEVGNPGEIPDDLGFLRDYWQPNFVSPGVAAATTAASPYNAAVHTANPLFEKARQGMAEAMQMTPPAPTTPALRTQDLLTGLAPMLLASLVGPSAQREGNANAYGQGYLQGKQLKAQQDTEAAQNAFRAQQQGQIAAAQGLNQQGQQILDQGVRQQSILDTQSKLKAEERKQTTDQIIKARTAFQTAAKGDNVAAIDAAANDLKSLGVPLPETVVDSAKQQINSRLNTKVLAQLSRLGSNFSEAAAKAAFMERGLSEDEAAAKAKELANSPTRKAIDENLKIVKDDVKNSTDVRRRAMMMLRNMPGSGYEGMSDAEMETALAQKSPARISNDRKDAILAAREVEINATTEKIKAATQLNNQQAKLLAIVIQGKPAEQQLEIAKGYAEIANLQSLVKNRALSAQQGANQGAADAIKTYTAITNDLRSLRDKSVKLQDAKRAEQAKGNDTAELDAQIESYNQSIKAQEAMQSQILQLVPYAQKAMEKMQSQQNVATTLESALGLSPFGGTITNANPYQPMTIQPNNDLLQSMPAMPPVKGNIGQNAPAATKPAGGWNKSKTSNGATFQYRKKGA